MTEANSDQNEQLRLLAKQQRSAKLRALGREMELRAEIEIWKLQAASRELELKAELSALESRAASRELELSSQLSALESRAASRELELSSQLQQLSSQLQQLSSELEVTRQHAAAKERELNSQLQAIIHSHSWKLTQPLRDVTDWARSHSPRRAEGTGSHEVSSPTPEGSSTTDVHSPVVEEAKALLLASSQAITDSDRSNRDVEIQSSTPALSSAEADQPSDAASQLGEPDQSDLDVCAENVARDQDAASVNDDSFATSGREAWDEVGSQRLNDLLAGERRRVFPRPTQPTVSIIVLLYNKAHLALLCLESILSNADVPYELILVDNGSTDNTGQLLQHLDGVEIVRNQENLGFGRGCMQGAERARGEYLCFLNNDAMLCPRSLDIAVSDFREDPAIGVVGGKILFADGHLQEAGSMVWSDGSAWGYGRGDDPELPRYQFRRPVDYSSGAFLFTPRSLFNELGGFDERFFPAYYEDTDYCFEVWDKGLKVVYEPRAVIRHYESASFGVAEASKRLIAAHQAKFAEKWQQRLRRHLPRSGESVPCARTAAQAGGVRILYLVDRVPHRELGSEFASANDFVREIVTKGHRVTVVSMAQPLQQDEYTDIARDVELVDAIAATHYVFRELLSQYDAVWIRGGQNLQRFLRHMRTMHDRVPPIIYEVGAISAEPYSDESQVPAVGAAEAPSTSSLEEDAALCGAAEIVLVACDRDLELLTEKGARNVRLLSPENVEQVLAEIGARAKPD